MRTIWGHSVSKANARHLGASTQFYTAPVLLKAKLKAEILDLNPPVVTTREYSLACLDKLWKSHVGGILLVLKHWNEKTAAFREPILQVVASPVVASLGALDISDPPGIYLGEVWDTTSSSPPDQLPVADTTCPIMVSSGGWSRSMDPSTIANYLELTTPLFIPSREKVAGVVTFVPSIPVWRAIYLPVVCNIPMGMFWKLDGLKLTTLINSVKALSSTATDPYAHFLLVLDQLNQLGSGLDMWLQQAAGRPDIFACETFRDASLSAHFPSLVTSAIPTSVSCVITISPLLNLRYLYAWRLFLDSVCSKSSRAADISYIQLFLERGLACMDSDTYLGAVLPSDLTPNFAFHFAMLHGLPTNPTKPFDDFARSEVVSDCSNFSPDPHPSASGSTSPGRGC